MSFFLSRNNFSTPFRPVNFEDFRRQQANRLDRELLDGSISERPMPPLSHETLRLWLQRILSGWVATKNWGTVFDGATPVEIADCRGRRPDLSLVSHPCRGIVRNGALYGAPDIIIEIAYANDLRDELAARERDYRLLGVREIILIDPVRRQVRAVRRAEALPVATNAEYSEPRSVLPYTVETLHCGETLCLRELDSICLPVSALMAEIRPPVGDMLDLLLTAASS